MGRVLTLMVLAMAAATPAAANEYRADRFDARIEVLAGGTLRVTETIVFRFEDGTFRKVERVIPTRRTDSVEFVEATMNGTPFRQGAGPGYVSVGRKEGLRIEWAFPPQGPSTHTFTLTYLARGVVERTGTADVVAWRALPTQHRYAIDQSQIEVLLPAAPIGMPRVQSRRVGSLTPSNEQQRIVVAAKDIRRNGWIEVSARMPSGSATTMSPAWQQRQQVYAGYRNPSLTAAAFILFAAIVLLFGLRQSYDAPPRDVPAPGSFGGPPDDLRPALAGALAANGTPKSEHAFAALFALAERGAISVEEERGLLGTRTFTLIRRTGTTSLTPHEAAVLETVFAGKGGARDRVTLSRAHSQVTRRFSKVREALLGELAAAGLLDPERQQVRRNYLAAGISMLVLAGVGVIAVDLVLQRYGPWLFVIPGALLAGAVASFIAGGAHTSLSNDGVRRSAAWRAYRKFLRETPSGGGPHAPMRLLPFAVALGLGMHWASRFKARDTELPAWFRAASALDAHRAFGNFVAVSGASHAHGVGGAGAAGAAGGGSSSAS